MIIYLEGPRDFLSIQERQWSLQDTGVQLRQVHLANDLFIPKHDSKQFDDKNIENSWKR